MNITLVDGPIKSSPAFSRFVREKVGGSIARFVGKIDRVRVHVSDANGPKGGIDKVCAIYAIVPGGSAVMVTHAAADYYGAVGAAARRLKTVLGRRLSRR